jgi:hypothetical protein
LSNTIKIAERISFVEHQREQKYESNLSSAGKGDCFGCACLQLLLANMIKLLTSLQQLGRHGQSDEKPGTDNRVHLSARVGLVKNTFFKLSLSTRYFHHHQSTHPTHLALG